MNRIIFVPSIQHTGTWFTIKFLEKFGFEAKEAHKVLINRKRLTNPTVIHSHFPILRDFDMNMDMDRWSRWQLTLKDRSLGLRAIELMVNIHPAVIPIRDPFAAILTREARHPNLRHFFIVDNFIELAQIFHKHPGVIFLPIDLPWTIKQREEHLKKIARHCGLDENAPHIKQTAAEWVPENITPKNRFKDLYNSGDLDQLQLLLGPKWAEVCYLRNVASILFPFLSDLGYTRGDIKI